MTFRTTDTGVGGVKEHIVVSTNGDQGYLTISIHGTNEYGNPSMALTEMTRDQWNNLKLIVDDLFTGST